MISGRIYLGEGKGLPDEVFFFFFSLSRSVLLASLLLGQCYIFLLFAIQACELHRSCVLLCLNQSLSAPFSPVALTSGEFKWSAPARQAFIGASGPEGEGGRKEAEKKRERKKKGCAFLFYYASE